MITAIIVLSAVAAFEAWLIASLWQAVKVLADDLKTLTPPEIAESDKD